jgi:hypothetical protein
MYEHCHERLTEQTFGSNTISDIPEVENQRYARFSLHFGDVFLQLPVLVDQIS